MADSPKATERQARTPLPPQKESPFKRPRTQILLLVLAMLAANYVFVAVFAPGDPEPVRIPYSPVFLELVREGNVERFSTQGATVDGLFKKDFTYEDAEPAKAFATEIPVFADSEELSKLLQDNGEFSLASCGALSSAGPGPPCVGSQGRASRPHWRWMR